MREFARQYVLCGGNATKAAILAGYSDKGAAVAGHRCLVHQGVLAEIKRLMVVNISAYLPIAVQTLITIASDPDCDPRARVQAANSLLDRAGLGAARGGTQVAVQVNVNGQQVQALIGEIWDARRRRESDIDDGMSDTLDATATAAIEAAPAEGEGGVHLQGPSPGPTLIPPPSDEKPPIEAWADRPLSQQSPATIRAVARESVRQSEWTKPAAGAEGMFD